MPDKKYKVRGDDPRLNEPKLRGDSRTLHLDDGVWQWKTNGNDVAIYSPAGERHDTTYQAVERLTDAELKALEESEDRFEFPMPGITPGAVKSYIETHLR